MQLLIQHATSNSFLATLGRHYALDTWVHDFEYGCDDPERDSWGKMWADVVEAWIGACERERVTWWEGEDREMWRWLEWVFCVRYVIPGPGVMTLIRTVLRGTDFRYAGIDVRGLI